MDFITQSELYDSESSCRSGAFVKVARMAGGQLPSFVPSTMGTMAPGAIGLNCDLMSGALCLEHIAPRLREDRR